MRIGTSNQLQGTIVFIHDGAVNGVVGLELSSGEMLTSSITMESIKRLGLKVGSKAYACVKATDVIIAVDD